MSSQEKLSYYMESAGLDNGVEMIVAAFLVVSVILGALIAKCILSDD